MHELVLDFRGESIADSIAHLQRFAAEVMPLVDKIAAQSRTTDAIYPFRIALLTEGSAPP